MKRFLKRMLAAVTLSAMLIPTVLGAASAAPYHSLIKVQPTNKVDVYATPSYDSTKLASLQTNDSVLITDFIDEMGWMEIFWNGGVGYIHMIDLKTIGVDGNEELPLFVDMDVEYMIGVAKSSATVYAEEGSGKIGTVRKGTYCVIVGETDGYYQILYGDQAGYVSKKSVTCYSEDDGYWYGKG